MCNLAGSYVADGQYAAALRLYQESLDVRTAKLGAHHRTTLDSLCGVAECLLALDRGAEAVQMIDKCLKQTAKDEVDPTSISALALLRLRPFEKAKDIAGCQATAELWETLLNDDAEHFYCAACLRAVTATVIRDSNDEHAAQNATAEVDRAMTWLQRAVRTGFGDVDRMRADADLDALRDRKDFQKLCAELEAAENTDD
jgi:tetratricopeptide (TPR) repeat protein